MNVAITGGAGFLGRRLLRALLARPDVERIDVADSQDVDFPERADPRVRFSAGDVADPAFAGSFIGPHTTSVFHFAAVVSGQAEADLALGMRVNVDGLRAVLEACRTRAKAPRFLFSSSIAVYGGDFPAVITDDTPLWPMNSYGTQKTIGELLVNDYSRRGAVDGRSLRFPTIVVRPGRPNAAASSFASGIIREPLAGERAICPVDPATRMLVMSPGRVIASALHVHDLNAQRFGFPRSLLMPGITVSVAEMIDALRTVAGDEAVARIEMRPDPTIERIVETWASAVDARRARALGLEPDPNMVSIVREYQRENTPR